jgi:hypothetical protein
MVAIPPFRRPNVSRVGFGTCTAQRERGQVPVLAVVMLAMVMAYSMVLVWWGMSWQIAMAVPVSLATATVCLVRLALGPNDRGAARLARAAWEAVALARAADRAPRSEHPN